jgi:hydroxymethylpyrimidine synthase
VDFFICQNLLRIIQEETMTILKKAQAGEITAEMIYVAQKEGLDPENIRQGVAVGEIVILKSSRPKYQPGGGGQGSVYQGFRQRWDV